MLQVMSFMSDSRPIAVRRNDAAAAYGDGCFGESKVVCTGGAWPMPAHEPTSNLNSARAQVGMCVTLLLK